MPWKTDAVEGSVCHVKHSRPVDHEKPIKKKFGKLDFEQLFITAQNYALNGYPVYEIAARDWNENLLKLSKNQNSKKISTKFLKQKLIKSKKI